MMLNDAHQVNGASNNSFDKPDLRLRLVGQMQILNGADETVLLLGRRSRILLAILALSEYPVTRHRLARMLWSTRGEEQRRASLRQEIHRVHEALEAVAPGLLQINREHMAIRHDRIWLDVVEGLTATIHNPAPLALLSGVLLDEYDQLDPVLDEWLATEREKIRIHARTVLDGQLALQRTPEGRLAITSRLLQFDPAHESAWRARIQAYANLGDRDLSIEAYERCQAALRQKLGAVPDEETRRLVDFIRKTGDVPQTDGSVTLDSAMLSSSVSRAGPLIGVLPFQLSGMDPEQAFLSIALADEITTALAHFPDIGLVAPSTLASCVVPDALHKDSGLDILVEGRLYTSFDGTRIILRMIDLRDSNRVIWSRCFKASRTHLLSLHDGIVGQMAAQLELEIQVHESSRASSVAVERSSAFELVSRAWPMIFRFHRPEFEEAEALLRRAIALEPDYPASRSRLAYHLLFAVGQSWVLNRQAAIEEATKLSERAVLLAPRGARALTIAGHIRAYLHRRPKEAMELHEQALSLNPNLALAWGLSALACIYLGAIDEASRRFKRYQYLSPNDTSAFLFESGVCVVEIARGNYAAAVDAGRRATELNSRFTPGLRHYLVALGHAGMKHDADLIRKRLLFLQPDLTVQGAMQASPYEDRVQREHFGAGLRLGGVPEH